MKCSALLRLLTRDGWFETDRRGSHVKLKHLEKSGVIIFPDHGKQEVGKGLERKLMKQAGIMKR
jgi:mRNA interferase HicA